MTDPGFNGNGNGNGNLGAHVVRGTCEECQSLRYILPREDRSLICGLCDADELAQAQYMAGRESAASGRTRAAEAHEETTGEDRYAGRDVDLGPLLAAPAKPVPWRVRNLVADGTVTILSGDAGCGKSWLAQALCTGVATGLPAAGLECARGRALYVDAEMGPQMFVDQRLRPAGITESLFEYLDAMGLDISRKDDLAWIKGKIAEHEANLIVIDSLRQLTPSKAENDSDDMAPTIGIVSKLSRDTGAAILLLHHKGDSEKFYRGSTAIKCQTDALFGLLREGDQEDDDNPVRRLRCRGGKGKMRYAPEPPDIYMEISPSDGGVAACDAPPGAGQKQPAGALVKRAILGALPTRTKADVAEKVGRSLNDRTFRDSWKDLKDAGTIRQTGGEWVGGSHPDPREKMTTPLDAEDGEE